MTTRNLVRSLLIFVAAATAAYGDPIVAAGPSVQIEGVISAKGSNTITVNAEVITVSSETMIRHGNRTFTFADLKVGDRIHVVGMRGAQSLEATEVKLQNPGEQSDPVAGGCANPGAAAVAVCVTVLDANGAEIGNDPVSFTLTRTGDVSAPLTVDFDLGGTTANFVDYQAHWYNVEFLAGESTAVVTIIPVVDDENEGSETVILTVLDGTGYKAGSPAVATATIVG